MQDIIPDDDAELLAMLRQIPPQPVFTITQLSGKPYKRRKLQHEIETGRLKSYVCDGLRLIDAIEYARWLVSLRRRGRSAECEKQRRAHASEAVHDGHRRARQTRSARTAQESTSAATA